MGFEFERIYKGTDEFPIGLFSQSIYIDQAHHHIEYELFYLAEGECFFGIEDNKIKIYPGDVIFIPPATNHYVAKTENNKDYHYYAMVFDISNSMLAKDCPGNTSRLDAASLYAKKLLSKMEGTPVAVILAKGDGVAAIPLTDDTSMVESLLEVMWKQGKAPWKVWED